MGSVTGKMGDAHAFRQANGCTALPLELAPFASYFVVFHRAVSNQASGKSKRNFPKLTELSEVTGSWKVAFDPTWGGPGEVEFPKLMNWINRPEEGIKYYSGKVTYRKTFDLPTRAGGRLFLDLDNVKNVAEVRLNGKKLGILWCAPWRVEYHRVSQGNGQRAGDRCNQPLGKPGHRRFGAAKGKTHHQNP
jgi:hypothetical protein